MKKIIVLLAALCLPAFLFGCAPAEQAFEELSLIPRNEASGQKAGYSLSAELTSARIRDESGLMIDYSVTDPERLASLAEILKALQPFYGEAEGPGHFLELTTPESTATIFVRAGERIVFEDEGQFLEADRVAYISWLDGLPEEAYAFAKHPAAALTGMGLEPIKTTCRYLRLDGSYAAPEQPDPPEDITLTDWPLSSPLPLPEFSREPSAVLISVRLNGAVIFEDAAANITEIILEEASRYEVTATAGFDGPYSSGEAAYTYVVETVRPPEISIETAGAETFPGEVVILRVNNLKGETPPVCETPIANTVTFYPDGEGGWTALLPVSYITVPGEYYADITAGGLGKRVFITVRDKRFEEQHLVMDGETTAETLESEAANYEYNRVYYPLRFESDTERYWQGRFIRPVEGGRITTPFAVMRYTNDDPTPQRHGALDIALPTGSPVYAPNRGRVQFAGFLTLTGYSIMIEHGLGLKTWYYHMDSVAVSTGDMVEQGQKIGEVGSTGYSTGPHLHYGMSVRDVMINPDTAELSELFAF
ncbi:MAG: M23 family metallopeptidase [Oscillospiraceae bacterium]|jgi:murein DD-endopeptidase MepM/ murein hydrolase activator NlpD|nr:M23 family metallopeptidase [Oscillospiraceae bacterium]